MGANDYAYDWQKPHCKKCGHVLYPCEGCAKGEEAGPDAGTVYITYCAVCDVCTNCDFQMSPPKGVRAAKKHILDTPYLEIFEEEGHWDFVLNGSTITMAEAISLMANFFPPPVLVTMPPDVGPEQINELARSLREMKNVKGITAPAGATVSPLWPVYEYLTFEDWLRARESDSFDTVAARAAWNAARQTKDFRPQDVVSSEE
jgi:hypothetical protein